MYFSLFSIILPISAYFKSFFGNKKYELLFGQFVFFNLKYDKSLFHKGSKANISVYRVFCMLKPPYSTTTYISVLSSNSTTISLFTCDWSIASHTRLFSLSYSAPSACSFILSSSVFSSESSSNSSKVV